MLTEVLYKYMFGGSQDGTWGGAECATAVSTNTHILETALWLCVTFILWKEFELHSEYDRLLVHAQQYYAKVGDKKWSIFRYFEIILGLGELVIWLLTVYNKINKFSICYMFQPCHIVLAVQACALLTDNALGSVLSTLSLSTVIGTVLATLFPSISGLDQLYEAEMYWIQHYVIQVVPILLLLRNDGLMLKMTKLKSIIFANWCVVVLHWIFYQPMDVFFSVNVMFMLCPTDAMVHVFSRLPSWLLFPSYRSTLTVSLFLLSIPLSYCYIVPSYIIHRMRGGTRLTKQKQHQQQQQNKKAA
jgi:hypothetical protein